MDGIPSKRLLYFVSPESAQTALSIFRLIRLRSSSSSRGRLDSSKPHLVQGLRLVQCGIVDIGSHAKRQPVLSLPADSTLSGRKMDDLTSSRSFVAREHHCRRLMSERPTCVALFAYVCCNQPQTTACGRQQKRVRPPRQRG